MPEAQRPYVLLGPEIEAVPPGRMADLTAEGSPSPDACLAQQQAPRASR